METCDKHEMSGCTFCSGKFTHFTPVKPITAAKKKGRKVKKAPVDREMVIADRVARGEICEFCLTEIAPIGCVCSRRRFYEDHASGAGLVANWLEEHHEAFMPAGTEDAARALRAADMIVSGLAFSTQTRAARRAGLSRDNGRVAPSEVQADRLEILERFGIEPRWRQLRRQEADHLPA